MLKRMIMGNKYMSMHMHVQVFRQPSRSCFFFFIIVFLLIFSYASFFCHAHLLLSSFFFSPLSLSLSRLFFSCISFRLFFSLSLSLSSLFVPSFLSLLLAAMIMMLIDGTNMTKTKGASTIDRLRPIY